MLQSGSNPQPGVWHWSSQLPLLWKPGLQLDGHAGAAVVVGAVIVVVVALVVVWGAGVVSGCGGSYGGGSQSGSKLHSGISHSS